MEDNVSVGKYLDANNSFVGDIGLPTNFSIGVSQDKVTKWEDGFCQLACRDSLPKPNVALTQIVFLLSKQECKH